MATFRLIARILAVAACLVATSCGEEAAPSSKPPPPPKPPPGPCFLFVTVNGGPVDQAEVLINGQSLAALKSKGGGGPAIWARLTFTSSEKTHIVMRLLKGDTLLYQPEFDIKTGAGDLVSAQFMAGDKKPQTFGPHPSHDFPALVKDVPARVWCWFGPANRRSDYVGVQLAEGADADAFKTRTTEGGYTIVREFERGRIRVAPPKGVTIVEAVLDIETWPGVKQVYFEPKFVY